MKKENIWKLVSLLGILLGGAGTLLSSWASDKELDSMIDEKLDERLTARKKKSEEP